jgi:hypothetical protein
MPGFAGFLIMKFITIHVYRTKPTYWPFSQAIALHSVRFASKTVV